MTKRGAANEGNLRTPSECCFGRNGRVSAIATKRLRPGDILLSRGQGDTADAIRTLDGGTYSHAGIWSGSGVIELTTPKVVEWPLEQSLIAHPRVMVDVYRYSTSGARQQRVVEMARRYVG